MFTIYHDTTDISDVVKNVEGLEWRRDFDYSMVLPHPILKVYDREADIDDIVYFTDTNRYFKLKVVKCDYDYNDHLYVWKLFDYMHELREYRICELTQSWWSGYSPSTMQFRYVDTNGADDWDKQYIQVLFAIKVMLHHACGVDITDVVSTGVDALYSPYKQGEDYILYQKLAFCYWQMKCIGLDVYADTQRVYRASDLFEVINEILRALNLALYYYADKYYIVKHSAYLAPDNDDIWEYAPQEIEAYDSTQIKCKASDNLEDYYADGVDGLVAEDLEDIDEVAGSTLFNARKKSFTLPNNFEIHVLDTDFNEIAQMLSIDNKDFYEQMAELKHDTFGSSYTVIQAKVELTKDREPYVNTFIYESDDEKITEQASIIKYDVVDTFDMEFPIGLGRL